MKNNVLTIKDIRDVTWYWIQKDVYSQYASKIGVNGLALYNAYCFYANHITGVAYPSIERICKDLKISRQTVFKYNAILEKKKLIKIISGKGRKNVNEVYILKLKVNLVKEKVNVATEKVNDVDTEQALLTSITNNKGLDILKRRMKTLNLVKSF